MTGEPVPWDGVQRAATRTYFIPLLWDSLEWNKVIRTNPQVIIRGSFIVAMPNHRADLAKRILVRINANFSVLEANYFEYSYINLADIVSWVFEHCCSNGRRMVCRLLLPWLVQPWSSYFESSRFSEEGFPGNSMALTIPFFPECWD
jgi:hypothetical protein